MKIFLPLLIAVVLLTGCAPKKITWLYQPNTYATQNETYNKKVVIMPFIDNRTQDEHNTMLLGMMPLVPYGVENCTEANVKNYNPKDDFAKSLAREMNATGFFLESYFSYSKSGADIVCSGDLLNTRYYVKMYTYGVSGFSTFLWLIGLPGSTVSNYLSVRMYCQNTATGDTIIDNVYTAPTIENTNYIYSPKNNFNYPVMLKDIYKQFVVDLKMKIDGRNVSAEEIRNAPPESAAPEQ